MKKFTIEVKNASGPQLQTIGLELKIMSNGWAKYGPRIRINGQELQAPSLRTSVASYRRQASGRKRHNMAKFI
jgi:hypothetical protein